jgi:hypothetical protein
MKELTMPNRPGKGLGFAALRCQRTVLWFFWPDTLFFQIAGTKGGCQQPGTPSLTPKYLTALLKFSPQNARKIPLSMNPTLFLERGIPISLRFF